MVQLILGSHITTYICQTFLISKSIAAAVGAPDAVLPPPTQPGIAGLLALYVSIVVSFLGSLVLGLLSEWLIQERGEGERAKGKAAAAAVAEVEDEEAGLLSPLLGRASWEVAEKKSTAGGAAGGKKEGEEDEDDEEGKVRRLGRRSTCFVSSISNSISSSSYCAYSCGTHGGASSTRITSRSHKTSSSRSRSSSAL